MHGQIRRLAGRDDVINDSVGRSVMAAFEAGKVQDSHVWMTRSELRAPNLLHAVGRIILGPDIPDIERSLRHAGFVSFLEPTPQPGCVLRDRTNRQNRITECLKIFGQSMILTWVGVVRSPED